MPAFNYNYSPTGGSGSFNIPSFQDILGASPQDFISYLTGQKLQLQQPLIDLQRSQLGEQGREFDVTNQFQNRALAQRLPELAMTTGTQRYVSDAPLRLGNQDFLQFLQNRALEDVYNRTHSPDPRRYVPRFLDPSYNTIA